MSEDQRQVDGGPAAETLRTSNVSTPTAKAQPATILAWAQAVASSDIDKIKEGFQIQQKFKEEDQKHAKGACSERVRTSLKNNVQLGTGSFLVFMNQDSPKLNWICGMGTFSDGFNSSSAYDGMDIGLITDRIDDSEPTPGAVGPKFWKYFKCEVSASALALGTFYSNKENRTKFYAGNGDEKTFRYMPVFLMLPQELVAWFLEEEPTAFELYQKLASLDASDVVPDELELALEWCLCGCNEKVKLRQAIKVVLFSNKEKRCAKWYTERVETLLGKKPGSTPTQLPSMPQTPGQPPAPPAVWPPAPPAVTPSPTKPKFFTLSETGKATITILSAQVSSTNVSSVWGKFVVAQDIFECATHLQKECDQKRKDLKITDGSMPNLDYFSLITDFKAMKFAPGGQHFSFDKFGEGVSLLQCRELTALEASKREQRQAAASVTQAAGNLTYQDNLNLLRRDPADPPGTYGQLLKGITAYGILTAVLFTQACPHFQEVWKTRELIAGMDKEENRYFTAEVCRLITFYIIRDAHQYFSHVFSQDDLNKAVINFPSASLANIGSCIHMMTLPPTPVDFPQKWRPSGADGGKHKNDGFGGGNSGGDAKPGGGFGRGTEIRAAIHSDFVALVEPLVNKSKKFNVGDICRAANISTRSLPYLNNAGSSGKTCYNHLLGVCPYDNCNRYHAPKTEIENCPAFRHALCAKLKPGVDRMESGSRKRPWGQN